MEYFQLKISFFYIKSAIKTIIVLPLLLFCFFHLSAQKEHKVKLKIETGLLFISHPHNAGSNSGFGDLFLRVEPKLQTSKNTFIGLRIGILRNTQTVKNSDPLNFYIDNKSENGTLSFVPTFDYYFSKNKLRPFLGVGIGYYFLDTYTEVSRSAYASDRLEASVNNQVGFLLRGGLGFNKLLVGRVDLSKFFLGLEFNYIPKADVELTNGQRIGTVANSFIGLAFGYSFGLRKGSK